MDQSPRRGELRDKFGHLHSENIFKDWSPVAIVALGIHRVGFPGALMTLSVSTPIEEDVPATAAQHQYGE
jgi:hypothetical protein